MPPRPPSAQMDGPNRIQSPMANQGTAQTKLFCMGISSWHLFAAFYILLTNRQSFSFKSIICRETV